MVLSVDVANHPVHGDLTVESTVWLWISLLRSGRVAAMIAGPPCETWSAPRHLPIPANAPGGARPPRPLRSKDALWGFGHVNARESAQIALGNDLLRTTVRFLYEAWIYGVPALMEHPSTNPR
eukprot:9225451-Pyramimonas_sp.AAC.1